MNHPDALPADPDLDVIEPSMEAQEFVPRRRRNDDSEMDITPMIDITFLLLIFFLVASKMDADSEVLLPAAKNGTAVATKESAMITVTLGSGDAINIYLGDGTKDDTRIASTDFAEQEAAIAAYVDEMMFQKQKEQVVIKAAREVKHRDIARVMQAVGQVENTTLFVAVLEDH